MEAMNRMAGRDLEADLRRFSELIAASSRAVVFTGAGISAESGIATYRGQGGVWHKYDPEKYASIDYFRIDPSYYWRFFKEVRHDMMVSAQPNAGHLALARWERTGRLRAVITQNIDGLHQKAGSRRVLELHGNTTRFYCCDCRAGYDMATVRGKLDDQLPPRCDLCSGVLRPDVVLFGEMLPGQVLDEAEQEARTCDLMVAVGSSLVVYPAANLPAQAKLCGARLVIVNLDPTPLDDIADLCIRRAAGAALPVAVDAGLSLFDAD